VDAEAARRRQAQLDVAVRDARLRCLADLGLRALRERRVALLDAEADLGAAVVGDRDLLDRAGGHAADDDGVALDELAGVLEHRPHLVARAAAEEDDRDEDDRAEHGRERSDTPYSSR
jgi:hypothetical protein